MGELLFLSHRIPYPPNKGDKIRSWNFLRHLAQRYSVRLACLIDHPRDLEYVAKLRSICAEVIAVELDPLAARLRYLGSLLARQPLSCGHFRHPALRRAVETLFDRVAFDRAFVFSSPMAGYVLHRPGLAQRTVVDMVDVDSDKWRQFAAVRAWPQRSIYAYEARRLLEFERRVAGACAASLFATEAEADLFRRLAPETAARIRDVSNGVDAEFFSPDRAYENPYPDGAPVIVFTGAMDYWPNVEAVVWMAREVMPRLASRGLAARFYIVGSNPTAAVHRLSRAKEIVVQDAVPDVRPYLRHAAAAVAPLRTARGVQNKVLEAMAMACEVVVSPQALQGIQAVPGRDLYQAASVDEFASTLAKAVAAGTGQALGRAARRYVLAMHDWQSSFRRLDAILENLDANQTFDASGTAEPARAASAGPGRPI